MNVTVSSFSPDFPVPEQFASGKDVFFDIETTGLNWRKSHIYLIGAAVFRPETGLFEITQWFADHPAGESELLDSFVEFLRPCRRLVHYNGDTFDLPYLCRKYRFYHGQDFPAFPETLDLYRCLRPLRTLFGLSSMKQKELETFSGFRREDPFTGGELIGVYQDFLAQGKRTLLDALYLHNKEDLIGLVHTLSIYGFFSLFTGSFQFTDIRVSDGTLTLTLAPDAGGLCPLRQEHDHGKLCSDQTHLTITVPGQQRELKFFFDNYRDYYYLPQEDNAVHKSVGIYVDAQYREKAKASNCYQRHTGRFFWQPSEIFSPVFREQFRSRDCYFEWNDTSAADSEKMHRYAKELFCSFL